MHTCVRREVFDPNFVQNKGPPKRNLGFKIKAADRKKSVDSPNVCCVVVFGEQGDGLSLDSGVGVSG